MTSTVPAGPAGAVAVRVVGPVSVMEAARVVPKSTVAPGPKPVPVTVTMVPPASGPSSGETVATTGAAVKVNRSDGEVELVPPAVVTVTSTAPVPEGEVAVRLTGLV